LLPHRAHDPWLGETWFFEKGCTSTVPLYPVELMKVGATEEEAAGELADAAASILMTILYGARMGRWDLL
jgi:hypothetical protein